MAKCGSILPPKASHYDTEEHSPAMNLAAKVFATYSLPCPTLPPSKRKKKKKKLTVNWLIVCGTCGVSVGVAPKKELESEMPVRPVNVRNMNGVDLEKLRIKKVDGWSKREPQYEAK
ncbi:MAG: hypothetical protein Q9195_002783 [Heterodermia aff. obscurata]